MTEFVKDQVIGCWLVDHIFAFPVHKLKHEHTICFCDKEKEEEEFTFPSQIRPILSVKKGSFFYLFY